MALPDYGECWRCAKAGHTCRATHEDEVNELQLDRWWDGCELATEAAVFQMWMENAHV